MILISLSQKNVEVLTCFQGNPDPENHDMSESQVQSSAEEKSMCVIRTTTTNSTQTAATRISSQQPGDVTCMLPDSRRTTRRNTNMEEEKFSGFVSVNFISQPRKPSFHLTDEMMKPRANNLRGDKDMMVGRGKSIRLPVSIHTYSCSGSHRSSFCSTESAKSFQWFSRSRKHSRSRSSWGAKYQSALLITQRRTHHQLMLCVRKKETPRFERLKYDSSTK